VAPIIGIAHGPALTPNLLGRIHGETVPLLLTGRFGAGRVAVLNAAGVYRWGLTAVGLSSGGLEGAFFGGLVRWLEGAGDDRPVRLEAPDVSAEGAGVPVRLLAPEGSAGATARVTVLPDRRGATPPGPVLETLLSPTGDGAFTATLPLPPGVHRLRATLERGGRIVGRDSSRIAVGSGGLEFEALAAEPGTLERLAAASGGVMAPLAAPEPVLERLRSPDAARARLAEIDLFHNPTLFAILILALTVEWALRKRFHLL
jgi:hypothetical protein